MNPGVPNDSEAEYPENDRQALNIHVRRFGQIVTGRPNNKLHVSLNLLGSHEAAFYTRGTVGTSGSAGITNLSIPEHPNASLKYNQNTAEVDDSGTARFWLTATDPKNVRGYVDGQIYFIRYSLAEQSGVFSQDSPTGPDRFLDAKTIPIVQDPNDLVSVQIYDVPSVKGEVTWDNGVGEILKQFAFLYPVMARIGLNSHEKVKTNGAQIKHVIGLPITHPLHMPVTRDLSVAKRKMIIDWIDAGAP